MTHTGNQESTPTKTRLQLLLQRFARAAREHYAALEALDAEQAETQVTILAGLHKALIATGETGVKGLLGLAAGSDPVIAGMAAVYSLPRNSELSLAALRRVAQEPGLLGFRAGMAIERWESGEWDG